MKAGMLLWSTLLASHASTACAQAVDITATSTLPLEVSIPLSKKHTTMVKLWQSDGRCHVAVGPFQPVDLELPAPCDIQTLGASGYGFKPWVVHNEKSDVPDRVLFRIVGALKYFPDRRAECGTAWRDVEIDFPKGSSNPGGPKPTLSLGRLGGGAGAEDILRCPRFYSAANKLWFEVKKP